MADQTKVQMEIDEMNRKSAELRLMQAEFDLEEAKEKKQQRDALRKRRDNQAKQNLHDLEVGHSQKRAAIGRCSHRQGTGLKRDEIEQGGSEKNPSALRGSIMPDNRRLIMCSNCPLRVFEPRKADSFPRPRRGESENAAKKRVEGYHQQMKDFELLWKHSEDQLTKEAAQPMHCGVQFDFTDQNGQMAHVASPCDSYAQGLDNRKEPAKRERAA